MQSMSLVCYKMRELHENITKSEFLIQHESLMQVRGTGIYHADEAMKN